MQKNLAQVTKLLEKVFKAGFLTEKDILAVQLEDLVKIPDITGVEIKMLVDLKNAIRNKKLIAFLSGTNERKEVKVNESRI